MQLNGPYCANTAQDCGLPMICYAELLSLKGHDSEAAFNLSVLLLESKEHELSLSMGALQNIADHLQRCFFCHQEGHNILIRLGLQSFKCCGGYFLFYSDGLFFMFQIQFLGAAIMVGRFC